MVNNILILALGKLRLEDQEFKASQGNMVRHHLKKKKKKNTKWLTPVILTIQEAEIGKIMVQNQSRQKVPETQSQPM
jgi:predicted CopG family antitoxin